MVTRSRVKTLPPEVILDQYDTPKATGFLQRIEGNPVDLGMRITFKLVFDMLNVKAGQWELVTAGPGVLL